MVCCLPCFEHIYGITEPAAGRMQKTFVFVAGAVAGVIGAFGWMIIEIDVAWVNLRFVQACSLRFLHHPNPCLIAGIAHSDEAAALCFVDCAYKRLPCCVLLLLDGLLSRIVVGEFMTHCFPVHGGNDWAIRVGTLLCPQLDQSGGQAALKQPQ